MKAELTIIPKISIHPKQINFYNEIHWNPQRPVRKEVYTGLELYTPEYSHLLESSRTANGNVSKIAKRKIGKAIDYLLLMASEKHTDIHRSGKYFKFRVSFITLTLPSQQIHDDNTIKSKCLNQFIIEIKKAYKVKFYVWRAEKQKNGNLHFHILTNKFIPHQEVKDRWNRIIEKLGYISRYRETQEQWHKNGFKPRPELYKTWSKEKQYQAYLRGTRLNWNSPNSTDIHALNKVHNIKLYITKYLTKNESNPESLTTENESPVIQQGRIWSCSENLMDLKGAVTELYDKLEDELNKLKKLKTVRTLEETYYSCLFFDSNIINPKDFPELSKLFLAYLFQQFGFNNQFEFFP